MNHESRVNLIIPPNKSTISDEPPQPPSAKDAANRHFEELKLPKVIENTPLTGEREQSAKVIQIIEQH